MSAKEKLLIAEDNAINRQILSYLLSPEYELIEAENGQQALDLLRQYGTAISCVLLDLVMPVMDGFGFLEAIQGEEAFANIPIIVATGNGGSESEVEALRLGAWDFITKPYEGNIIKFRVRGAIQRSQLSAFNQLKYMVEFDLLTGIYNKNKFFQATREMLDAAPDQDYAFVRLDIDRFQLINSFFGIEEGDRLLQYLSEFLRRGDKGQQGDKEHTYTYGRMEADVFAFCFPYVDRAAVMQKLELFKGEIKAYNPSFDIVAVFGVYFLDDLSLPVSEMLDRAALAAKTCKGNYIETVGVYAAAMSRRLEQEQEIINEMVSALEKRQFCVYLQPKYALDTQSPFGAEALVRWNHPQKGLISPGVFIPIFEKNGFIAKLDYYVWETVCALLRQWIDQGRDPAPISVNVSRVNLYNPDLVENITALVEKYSIPPRLLQLELTESAYMDNPQMIKQVVRRLHEQGFTILMDDFGSGYSSLSILKDVEVDILKIDMRFFEDTEISGRGENVVASIIHMAKWLGVPAVAEGAEKKEQISFLHSVGCEYVQGYYFARPMPVPEYEELIDRTGPTQLPPTDQQTALGMDIVWSATPEMELLFSNTALAQAIYEFDGKTMETLRVNEAFCALAGHKTSEVYTSPLRYISPAYHQQLIEACQQCVAEKNVTECVYQRVSPEGTGIWINLRLQYIQKVGDKDILLGHLMDVTQKVGSGQMGQAALTAQIEESGGLQSQVYSAAQMRLVLTLLAPIFDVVRLVDPEGTCVLRIGEGDQLEAEEYACFQVWKRNSRCENCTSRCSVQKNCQMSKYEYIKNSIFYVVSNPVVIQEPSGQQRKLVLEIVSHVSDHLILGQVGGQSIGQLVDETQQKIYTDELTGAYNRRYLYEMMFVNRQICAFQSVALCMLDLRDFKKINDCYGHSEGDRVLREVAAALRKAVRETDAVIRYGGDEFVVILTDCVEDQLEHTVSRLRKAVETVQYNSTVAVHADIGYAFTQHFEENLEHLNQLIQKADSAMYAQKDINKLQGLAEGHP